jgi:hypothetical protein
MFNNHPYAKHAYLGTYLRVGMGYHVGGMFFHFFDDRRTDYLEMFLHHSVTLYLMGGSYLFNVWETAAIVTYIHDFTDISVSIIKVLTETEYKITTAVVFVVHMIIWFYMRLVIFPHFIYITWVTPVDFGHWIIMPIYIFMLSCLALLHAHWFSLFIKLFIRYAKKGTTEDKMSNIEVKKVKVN